MLRLLFYCRESPGLARFAAAITRSQAPANLDLTCYSYEEDSRPDPSYSSVQEEYCLDASHTVTCSQQDAGRIQFDAVISLGQRLQAGWLTFPGLPVCIHWNLENLPADRMDVQHQQLYDELKFKAGILYRDGILESVSQLRMTFGSLIDNLTDGVLAHDRHRRILIFNRSAEMITGYRAGEVIGQDCHEIFPGRICGGDCAFCENETPIHSRLRYPTRFIRRDGEMRDLEMSTVTFNSPKNEAFGAMIIFRDMTEINSLRFKLNRGKRVMGLIGEHPSMKRVFEAINEFAGVNVPVLIQGESGTGKELVAEALHRCSARAKRPFVPINCGALPEGTLESELFGHVRGAFTGAIRDKKGRFELADGGTLFLDEIAEITPALQVKLLRVLQESNFVPVGGEKTVQVDVRIVCATNRDLKKRMQQGFFREDLYYRLAVVPIILPTLRQRRSDIPLLIKHFLERHAEIMGQPVAEVSPEAIEALMRYPWPGNVRELSNAVQYAIIKCHGDIIQPQYLPREILQQQEMPAVTRTGRPSKIDKAALEKALQESGGNRTRAAKILGVSRMTLYRHLERIAPE